MITKGTGGLGRWQMSGDHPNNNIVANGQSTEKSPGDLRWLAVTQNPGKDSNGDSNNNNNNNNNDSNNTSKENGCNCKIEINCPMKGLCN